MTKYFHLFIVTCLLVSLVKCKDDTPTDDGNAENQTIRWEFDDLNGWVDGSQNEAGPDNYRIIDGKLRIHTRPDTRDRAKVRTSQKVYTVGKYTWRIYIPLMGTGDQASIGAFLYNSDQHELDFEIGYGTSTDRNNMQATSDDLIVFMTSQANPYSSSKYLIKKEQWYNFSIRIDLISTEDKEHYNVSWYIDDVTIKQLTLTFGQEIPFYIFCSVENLTFKLNCKAVKCE